MDRVDEIISVTRWEASQRDVDWDDIEQQFGTQLPADYKKLCEAFRHGAFSGYLELLPPNAVDSYGLLGRWKSQRRRRESGQLSTLFDPYDVFDAGGSGLILWGNSLTEDQYYWLADASTRPEQWPIVARTDPLEDWHRFDISTTEFIYRVLTDRDFRPFSVAGKVERPFFETYE
ncbi:hypothetical protein ACU639_10225 [Streptomyces cynarae]|uniref:hypothetical protein n=1 Tax=Streptomyces cynarae TaxID=2981134 RepID=UPI00406C4BD2